MTSTSKCKSGECTRQAPNGQENPIACQLTWPRMRGDVAITADAERSRLVLLNFIVEDADDERVDVAVTVLVLSLDDNLGCDEKL